MGQWRDISTAPKDKGPIRVRRVYNGDVIADGMAEFVDRLDLGYDTETGLTTTYENVWIRPEQRKLFPDPTEWWDGQYEWKIFSLPGYFRMKIDAIRRF